MYLQNTVSIHLILSYPRCDILLKNEVDIDSSNKISFLNKNLFFDLFHLFHNWKGATPISLIFSSFEKLFSLFTITKLF